MFSNIPPEHFNVIEGCFWMALGLACLVIYVYVPNKYKRVAIFSVLTLITFGLSDFFEAIYGSFLIPGMEWLYIWKIVDVIGLCGIFIWYMILRIKP
jgi:hypothetical protein